MYKVHHAGYLFLAIALESGNAPSSVYLDVSNGVQYVRKANVDSFSAVVLKHRPRNPRASSSKDFVSDCSTSRMKCQRGTLVVAIDEDYALKGKGYEVDGMTFKPQCIPSSRSACPVAVVTFDGSRERSNTHGYFIYERDFGVRAFAFSSPLGGKSTGLFQYVSGVPLLR